MKTSSRRPTPWRACSARSVSSSSDVGGARVWTVPAGAAGFRVRIDGGAWSELAKALDAYTVALSAEMVGAADFFESPRHPYAKELLAAIPTFAKRGRPLSSGDASAGTSLGARVAKAISLGIAYHLVRRQGG